VRKKFSPAGIAIAMVVVAITIFFGVPAVSFILSTFLSPAAHEHDNAAWSPPDGYLSEKFDSGEPYGLKLSPGAPYSCGAYMKCFDADLISSAECMHVYVEVIFVDAQGRHTAWTNDSAEGVHPNNPVTLHFVTDKRDAENFMIKSADCTDH
jgi:hypothetical protein